MRVCGIDFTSAPRPAKPITVAVGHLLGGSQPVYALETVRELTSFPRCTEFLQEPGPWIGGFDLPFGQPRSLVTHEGWPQHWPEFVDFYCRQPRDDLRERLRLRPRAARSCQRSTRIVITVATTICAVRAANGIHRDGS